MKVGRIVEYIDRKKIICAVILEVKNQRLRLLTEANREVNLSSNRLSHNGKTSVDMSGSRQKTVNTLKEIANRRRALIDDINILELWEVLNTEQEWIDLATMTEFCFPDNPTCDHEAAITRAFFDNRLYFKFDNDRFFPNSVKQVEQNIAREKETARKNRIIEIGSNWLRSVLDGSPPDPSRDNLEFANILKSLYLYNGDSDHYAIGKAILAKAGINDVEKIFQILVRLGIFNENENIDLLRYNIPTDFSEEIMRSADELVCNTSAISTRNTHRDLTSLPIMTIDGQGTLDFDDSISIEDRGDCYRLGIHIIDVGHFVKKGDIIDQEALMRGSSIYMPDSKISMLPPQLAEEFCSLKAGEIRPAISIMTNLSRSAEIIDYEIFPSLVKVKEQLTYHDVNMMAEENKDIRILGEIAETFRRNRLARGAVQISLPDINIQLRENGEITVNKINRESPSRILVEELMILANWLMARFLKAQDMPAIFRSQPDPKARLYKGTNGTLYQNYMQRRHLSRFILDYKPEHHSGLGLNAYVTATSPIRKYFDLITQRQIRAVFDLEVPYTEKEMDSLIHMLELPMTNVLGIQYRRKRYWLLKCLEKKAGEKKEAIVLFKRKNNCQVLLTDYMMECNLPVSNSIELRPEALIQVTIQHDNAKKDTLSIVLC